ncbi:MAG: MBL fold metallo-hydrolase [Parasphingorhabdus sp.]
MTACQTEASSITSQRSTLFTAPWNSGIDRSEPGFHTQKIDTNTLVIRQSLHKTFEAPFLYLIFGDDRVLLIDTGVKGGGLRIEIDRQIDNWLLANGREKIALTVMHSHGHADHVGGDTSFAKRPYTEIVGHSPTAIANFFSIEAWPSGSASYDLGGRIVDILPTPGHHPSHVMVFDRATHILFSGDTIYPGKLYFQCSKLDEFRATIDKVATFASANDVQWLLGGHIEMKASPGATFRASKKAAETNIYWNYLCRLSAIFRPD